MTGRCAARPGWSARPAFPGLKQFNVFHFDANPNIPAALIHTLARAAGAAAGERRCLIGDSGTGKSHLLIALGTAAERWRTGSVRRPPPRWSTS